MPKTLPTLSALALAACLAATAGCASSESPSTAETNRDRAGLPVASEPLSSTPGGSATGGAPSGNSASGGFPTGASSTGSWPTGASSPSGSPRGPSSTSGSAFAAYPALGYAARPEVRAFLDELVARHGFAAGELGTLFAQVERSDDALRLMSPPPRGSFKRSWRAYRGRFIDQARVAAGVRFWGENDDAVRRAAIRYGVPEEIIVSIIGVETVYGRITGNHRVIDVLTTLAFDFPRRADHFRSELEQYLLLARQQGFDPFLVRGSYAGAIGLPQFMPGSIRRWAVDFDGDGRIDLRGSPTDAIGSVANFLAEHGWVRGEPLRFRARNADPATIAPLIEAGVEPRYTLGELRSYGVDTPDPVPVGAKLALIHLPNADDAPDYWLGSRNFYVITRYNRSSFYAMSVIELAATLRDARGL
jgi:membrane-bound lytic murein transglycosylase B